MAKTQRIDVRHAGAFNVAAIVADNGHPKNKLKDHTMNPFRSIAVVFALLAGMLALPAQAQQQQNISGDPLYTANAPKAFAMVGDLLIARPLLIGATVIGAGLFVVSLPFSAMGGGIGNAGYALVVEPGKEAFVRCLGCTRAGYNKQD
jgi:hypothetical protein